MTGEGIRAGDVVESHCGRDAGRLMLVLSEQDGMLALGDGRMRRVEQPKRKKPKHVRWVARPEPGNCLYETAEKIRSGGAVTNSELRRAMNAFQETQLRRDADVKG